MNPPYTQLQKSGEKELLSQLFGKYHAVFQVPCEQPALLAAARAGQSSLEGGDPKDRRVFYIEGKRNSTAERFFSYDHDDCRSKLVLVNN